MIFVVYNNQFGNIATFPDIYIVPSIEADKIKSSFGGQHRMMKGSIINFKDKWDYITEIGEESFLTMEQLDEVGLKIEESKKDIKTNA